MRKRRQRVERIFGSLRKKVKEAAIPFVCAAVLMLSSCGIFSPAGAGLASLTVEQLSNGYLIRIVAENDVGEAAAFVRPDNWLIVTIADSTLRMKELTTFRSTLVDSVEVTPFATAVQVSLRLTKQVDAVEVIRQKPVNEILISLFLRKQKK